MGENENSEFDLRFGRAHLFCVYNTQTKTTEFLKNENIDANGGAGTKTAEKVAELGVSKVISGHFGPKAKSLLEKLNIQMIVFDEKEKTVQEIINRIKN